MIKSCLLFSIWLFVALSTQAQSWNRTIGHPDSCCVIGASVKQLQSGSLYFFGTDARQSPSQLVVAKLAPNGDTIWTKNYAFNGFATAEYLNLVEKNNLIAVGSIQNQSDFAIGYFLLQLDTNGNTVLKQTYVKPDRNAGLEYVEQTKDKGFIACGFINQVDNGANDFLVVKLDSLGSIEWEKNYGLGKTSLAHMVHQTEDGGYIISGDTKQQGTENFDNYVIKLSKEGNLEWDLPIGNSYNNGNQAILITSSGDYLTVGEGTVEDSENFDILLSKITKEGKLLWMKDLGKSGSDAGFNVVENIKKEYLITGYSSSTKGSKAVFLAKIDGDGNSLGVKYFDRPELSIGYDIIAGQENDYFIAGRTGNSLFAIHTYDRDYTDTFQLKTLYSSTAITNSSKEKLGFTIFPNPATSYLNIQEEDNSRSDYLIYSILGQSIKYIHHSALSEISIAELPPGFYFIKRHDGTVGLCQSLMIIHD